MALSPSCMDDLYANTLPPPYFVYRDTVFFRALPYYLLPFWVTTKEGTVSLNNYLTEQHVAQFWRSGVHVMDCYGSIPPISPISKLRENALILVNRIYEPIGRPFILKSTPPLADIQAPGSTLYDYGTCLYLDDAHPMLNNSNALKYFRRLQKLSLCERDLGAEWRYLKGNI